MQIYSTPEDTKKKIKNKRGVQGRGTELGQKQESEEVQGGLGKLSFSAWLEQGLNAGLSDVHSYHQRCLNGGRIRVGLC